MPDSLVVSEISNQTAFRNLRKEWNDLQQRSSNSTPFSSWEWLYTWWEIFADQKNVLKIVTVSRGGRLIGLAPFQLEKRLWFRGGGILRFIGSGEDEADEVVSEYLDILVETGSEDIVVQEILNWISFQTNWRRLLFENVLQDSIVLRLCEKLPAKYSQRTRRIGFKYSVPLTGSFDDYLQRLSKSRRKRIALSERRLDKEGGHVLMTSRGPADFEHSFKMLADLNRERWTSKSKPCVFDSERFSRFHRQFMKLMFHRGQVAIHLLKLEKRTLAAVYSFYGGKTAYYYQSGFASEGANRYTPLWIAHTMIIDAAIASGCENYDFMRGDENSYKSEFGCDKTPMVTRHVFRSTVEYWIMRIAQQSIQRVRSLADFRNTI